MTTLIDAWRWIRCTFGFHRNPTASDILSDEPKYECRQCGSIVSK